MRQDSAAGPWQGSEVCWRAVRAWQSIQKGTRDRRAEPFLSSGLVAVVQELQKVRWGEMGPCENSVPQLPRDRSGRFLFVALW